jgi:hypothetical protein
MHRPLSARAHPRNKDPVRSADHELFPTQRLLTERSLVRVQSEAALTQSRNNLADAYRLAPAYPLVLSPKRSSCPYVCGANPAMPTLTCRKGETMTVGDVGEVVHDVFAAVCDADDDRAVGHAVLTDWRRGDQPPVRAQDPQSSTLIDSH